MVEPIRRTLTISAPPERVLSVVTDFENYPAWQKEVEAAEVLERDEQGRPLRAKMTAVAMGMKTSYEIAVTYNDGGLEWHLVEADSMTQNDTKYAARENGTGGTDLDCEMLLGLKFNLPEFMMKQIIAKGVNDNLKTIKKAAEAG